MIFYTVRVFIFALFVCCAGFAASAGEFHCKMGEKLKAEVSEQNFTVKIPRQSDLLVLSVYQSTKIQRTIATQILYDDGVGFAEAIQLASQLFARDNGAENVGSTILYLMNRLLDSSLDFVMLDLTRETITELEGVARNLYVLDVSYRLRFKKGEDDSLEKLFQVMVGAPIYVKTVDPDLYKQVAFLAAPAVGELTVKSLAGAVMNAKGRGMFFVPREDFPALKAEVRKACVK